MLLRSFCDLSVCLYPFTFHPRLKNLLFEMQYIVSGLRAAVQTSTLFELVI